MENVKVEYNNELISWVDFDTIFNSDQEDTDTTAKWTNVLAINNNGEQIFYILIWIPHFSENTITISSSVVEALSFITAMILYVTISAIVLFVFLSPMLTNIIHRRMYFKKRK